MAKLEYTTNYACNCLNGKCYFGKCICVTGFAGDLCSIPVSSITGKNSISIVMTFNNYLAFSFIIGLIWLFIGVGIGFFIFKGSYKKNNF